MSDGDQLIRKEFDFEWKKWRRIPAYAELALRYQKGDVLDVGAATCQILPYLKEHGWKGTYYGLDTKTYDDFVYPEGVNLIIGDALKVDFPKVDTVLLYNVLEHLEDPVGLLGKAIQESKANVLVYVPKRNEELWVSGVVEFHQLDKTHRHCGYSKEEFLKVVGLGGGAIREYRELDEINAIIGKELWRGRIPKAIMKIMDVAFSSRRYHQGIWGEVVKK